MVIEIEQRICDGYTMKGLLHAALDWLDHNQERVNRLNVFPVPDGDTGKNMLLTLKKGYAAIAHHAEPHVGIVLDRFADGALLGARGNSGVILSQLLRGFADEMVGHEVFDAGQLANAAACAVQAAYKAVIDPVEGTILTVAREAAAALVAHVEHDKDLYNALAVMLETARLTLTHTPELLPALKAAGVVDSGGQGLVFILEGMKRVIDGDPVQFENVGSDAGDFSPPEHDWANETMPDDARGYGYDVQFLMRGAAMDLDAVRADIDAMGWSTLVVGSASLIKVHVHVYDPGEPISYAIQHSAGIEDVVVENMQAQYEEFLRQQAHRARANPVNAVDGVAVITVTTGDGLLHLFREGLNAAYVISGGQTMNPSVDDFVQAINALENDEIILLPNNRNVVKAAAQAAAMTKDKSVRVVESVTVPQGIGAMLAYLDQHDEADLDTLVAAMDTNRRQIVSGEVTIATRDFKQAGLHVREGQYIGLVDGDLVSTGDSIVETLVDLLTKARADEHELITLYYGGELTETQVRAIVTDLEQHFSDQTFEVVPGGQPLYPLLIAIE